MSEKYKKHLTGQAQSSLADRLLYKYAPTSDSEKIFLASYPRSGNTWTRNLIAAAIHKIPLEHLPPRLLTVAMPEYEQNYYMPLYDITFFKTHDYPHKAFEKVIYIVRDARDVMTSFYHFRRARGYNVSWMEFVQNPSSLYGKWHEHVSTWLSNPYDAELLVIKYEDLQRDTVSTLRQMCEFSGVTVSDEDLELATKQANFTNAKKREVKYGQPQFIEPGAESNSYVVRKGQVGSHKEEMPENALAKLTEISRPTLERLGYIVEKN